jgi:hypothetical protein
MGENTTNSQHKFPNLPVGLAQTTILDKLDLVYCVVNPKYHNRPQVSNHRATYGPFADEPEDEGDWTCDTETFY